MGPRDDQSSAARSAKLEEICTAIDELCSDNVSLARKTVDPALLHASGTQLLAFCDSLSARGQARITKGKPAQEGGASNQARKKTADGACSLWADRSFTSEQSRTGVWHVVAALLVIALTLPYYVCVGYNSWFVDEGFAIYRNPDARGETSIWDVLQHDFWGTHLNPPEGYNTHKSFRPVITLSFALEWQLAAKMGFQGQEMKPMRLLCCFIHSFNALATFWLLSSLRLPLAWTFLGAALFATHPVHIENIVYIVGRADALATTFSLLALLLYLKMTLGRRCKLPLWTYVCLVVLAVLAGLSKETGFTVLFFIACAEVALRSRWRHVIGLLLCFALVGGVRTWYVGGTEAGFGYVDTPIRYQESKLTRTLSYLFQHAYHAQLLVLPWNQSWDYSYDALPMLQSFGDVRLLAIITLYLGVIALVSHGLHFSVKHPAAILGVGLIVIPFVPASNLFFLVGTTIAERLLYPCSVGWSVVVATLGAHARHKRRLCFLATGVLLVTYIVNSNIRMSHWHSPAVLFQQDAKHWSRSSKVLHSVGSELQAKGDLEGALDAYQRSLDVFDDTAITDYCIARILINLGRHQEALERFNKILTGHGIGLHDGNDFLWMTDLGYLLVRMGNFKEGAYHLQEGLNRMAWSCFGWNALGVAHAHLGDLQKAVEAFLTGIECDGSSASIWTNLAVTYAYGNAGQQAQEALQKSLALNRSNPVVQHNAAVLTGQQQAYGMQQQPQFDLYIPLPGRR